MKRLKKKNNPLWDRLLIEKNMKLFKKKNTFDTKKNFELIKMTLELSMLKAQLNKIRHQKYPEGAERIKVYPNYFTGEKIIPKKKYNFADILEQAIKALELAKQLSELKTNKMKTCKDCKYYEEYDYEEDDIMYCIKKDNSYTETDIICNDYKLKSKPMKRNKQEIKFIKEAYNSDNICSDCKTKIKETFSDIKFERKLAESWEEYMKMKGIIEFKFMEFRWMYTSIMEQVNRVEKYTALRKLELLRDHYNDGWKAGLEEKRFTIERSRSGFELLDYYLRRRFLYFKTENIRNNFLKNFKDLIEQAGDLV